MKLTISVIAAALGLIVLLGANDALTSPRAIDFWRGLGVGMLVTGIAAALFDTPYRSRKETTGGRDARV